MPDTDTTTPAPGPPQEDRHWLVTRPVPECIRRIAVPASVGFFFHTMFNVVDTWFAGLIGTTAQAALSLTFPVFFIVIAAGSGLQVGTTALVGHALGSRERDQAGLMVRQSLLFGLALAAVLTAVGLALSTPLYRALGAEGDYLAACLDYVTPIFWGAVFFLLIYVFNGTLQAVGDTKSFRNVLVAGAVLNVGLDPWFIYGGAGLPAMGLPGIAWATVLVQAMGAAYLGLRVRRTGLMAADGPGSFVPRAAPLAELARQSLPAGANYVTMGLGIFIITWFASRYGQTAVAGYGVGTRVEQILLMPTIGLNIATLSMTSQNYGAGRLDRVRETVAACLRYGAWIMAGGMVILLVGAGPLMGAFSDDPQVVYEGARFLRVAALILYAYVLLFVHVSVMQGLRRPMFALWVGLYRQIAAPALLFWLLTMHLELGVTAIWWGVLAVNWSAGVFSFVYARRVLARMAEEEAQSASCGIA